MNSRSFRRRPRRTRMSRLASGRELQLTRVLNLESLEDRRLLTNNTGFLLPDQVRTAYGLDNTSGVNDISFNGVAGNGAGQTIAIIDSGDDPNIQQDLTAFDTFATQNASNPAFSLPAPPSLRVVGQTGGAVPTFPNIVSITEVGAVATVTTASPETFMAGDVETISPTTTNPAYEGQQIQVASVISPTQFTFDAPPGLGNSTNGQIENSVDAGETSLDVEWAHAMAPDASIVLIECNSLVTPDIDQAVSTAAALGANVVSMSFGGSEYAQETLDDSTYVNSTTSYIVSSGDTGAPPNYAATSPNVLSVGATNLTINANNSYNSETAWCNAAGIVSGSEVGNTLSFTTATPTGLGVGQEFTIADNMGNDLTDAFGNDLIFQVTSANPATTVITATDLAGASGLGNLAGDSAYDGEADPAFNGNVGGTTGGPSAVEAQPPYQAGVVPLSMSKPPGALQPMRTTPDVSFIGGGGTPVIIFDSYDDPTEPITGGAGTSLSAPCWAGLVAIMDQGIVLYHGTPLSTSNYTSGLQAELYKLPSSDFHKITVGYNGYSSTQSGYDLVTGLGTPIANVLIPTLVNTAAPVIPPAISPLSTTAKVIEGGGVLKYATTPKITDLEQPRPVNDELQLSVNVGTLSVSGATIIAGANGTSSVTVQGTLAQLDAAIAGLNYTSSGITGAVLSITPIDPTSNRNNTSVAGTTAHVTITVQAPPVVSNLFLHTATGVPLSIDLLNSSTAPTDAIDPTTYVVANNLGNGTIAPLSGSPNIIYTPPAGFIGGDSFTYQVRSTAGLLSNVGTIVVIVGPVGSLSGYSYVDLNDDGIKQSTESGIQGVTFSLQGTAGNLAFGLTTTTLANGSFSFTGLPAGTYTITETEPGFFEHGKDTPGTPAPAGPDPSGVMSKITLTGNATSTESGSGYDFGELGLRAQFALDFLTERAFFASSEANLTGFNASTGDIWLSLDSGIPGVLTATAAGNGTGNVSLTLYNNNLQPLVTSPASATTSVLTYQGTPGQNYFLELSGTSTNATVDTSVAHPNWQNTADPEDVNGDGTVTPLDALAIINLLNEFGPGPLADMQIPAGIMPDVAGTGMLEPLDAVMIIDALNAPNNAAAVPQVAPAVVASTASVPVIAETSVLDSAAVTPAVVPAASNSATPESTADSARPAAIAQPASGSSPATASAAGTLASATPATSAAITAAAAVTPSTSSQSQDDSAAVAARAQFFATSVETGAGSKPLLATSRRIDPSAAASVLAGETDGWTGAF